MLSSRLHIIVKLILTAALLPTLTGCGIRVMKSSTLNVQGNKLRKTVAYRTHMLQVGEKVRLGGPNSFSAYDVLKVDQMPVTVTTSMTIDEVNDWLGDIGISGMEQITDAKGKVTYVKKEVGTFVVVAIQNRRPLIEVLNHPRNRDLLERMARVRDPRIVTAVATTAKQKSTKELTLDGTLDGSLTTVGLPAGNGKIHVKNEQKSTVEFSDGTVFAYELSIPVWSRDEKGQLIIADFIEDRPAWSNPRTPEGTWKDPKEVP